MVSAGRNFAYAINPGGQYFTTDWMQVIVIHRVRGIYLFVKRYITCWLVPNSILVVQGETVLRVGESSEENIQCSFGSCGHSINRLFMALILQYLETLYHPVCVINQVMMAISALCPQSLN